MAKESPWGRGPTEQGGGVTLQPLPGQYGHYIMEIPKQQMEYVGDMLRYDNCYEVEETAEGYRVHCTNFTPERWKSIGFVPKGFTYRVSAKEYDRMCDKAIGFTEGVRFAQKYLGGIIMQPR